MSQPDLQYVGIGVAKATLDVAGTAGRAPFTVSNDGVGFKEITDRLSDVDVSLIHRRAGGAGGRLSAVRRL